MDQDQFLEPDDHDFPTSDRGESSRPAAKGLLTAGVWLAYLPIAWIAGLARFDWGPRAYAPGAGIGLLLRVFFYWLVFCPVVSWPLVSAAQSASRKPWPDRPWRSLWAACVLCVPLGSLAWYLGDVRDGYQWLDIALAVVPASFLSVAAFRENRSPGRFVAWLGALSIVPFFLVGDVLGPLPTFLVFSSRGPAIYGWRALCAAAAIGIRLLLDRRPADRTLARATLAVAVIAIAGLLRWQAAALSAWVLGLSAAALAGCALVVGITSRSRIAPRPWTVLLAVAAAPVLTALAHPDASWAGQARLIAQVWGVCGIAWLGSADVTGLRRQDASGTSP
jgi:hypothetical protein